MDDYGTSNINLNWYLHSNLGSEQGKKGYLELIRGNLAISSTLGLILA